MMGLLKIFQPFRQWPEPESSLNLDPVWSELRDRYRKDRADHAKSEPSWKALNSRVHQLLRGRA
jgi:hypothetical protein